MNPNLTAWSWLAASIAAEVIGTVGLRHSDGFSKLLPTALAGSGYVLAVWLMSLSLKQIEMGLAYAIWAAGGTAITALIGMSFYGESTSALRLTGLALVVAGVVVLNLESR